MKSDWQTFTVDELKADSPAAIAMGPFGSDIKTDNFVPEGVPVIRGTNLSGDRFRDEGFVFLTEDKADELRNANAFPGTLCSPIEGLWAKLRSFRAIRDFVGM